MTKQAAPKKIKKLSLKRSTVKDLDVKSGRDKHIKGGYLATAYAMNRNDACIDKSG